ncbi:MAG TPA: hypothetical protein VFC67_27650 [Prolixibacteraceae bacterium]|nr:hypothetical protein [Prolixibacteraceae bacterium]
MKTKKQLGIWMDHSTANLIGLNADSTENRTILAQVGEQDEALNSRDETLIQNKEQNELTDFFSRLSDVIINYDEVLLFGPTNAKTELVNIFNADHRFDEVKIEVKTADKMTENQQQAFVKEHFNTTR